MYQNRKKQGIAVLAVLALLLLITIALKQSKRAGTEAGSSPTREGITESEKITESEEVVSETDTEAGVEPEPVTEDATVRMEQAEEISPLLGEEIESYSLQLNGIVLKLPCTVKELEATGFLIRKEDREEIEGYIGESGDYEAKFEDKRGNYIITVVFIPDAGSKIAEEFQVIEIEVRTRSLEKGGVTVVFPGGIQMGSSMGEEVLAAYSPPDRIQYGEKSWEYEREDADVGYEWFDAYYHYKGAYIATDKEGKVDLMLISYGGELASMKREFAQMVLGRWSPYPESEEKLLHTTEFRRYPDRMGGNKDPYVEYVDESGRYYGYNTYEVINDTTIRAVFDSFTSAEGERVWQSEPEKGFTATYTYEEESQTLKVTYQGKVPDIKKEEKTLYRIKTTDIWGRAWKKE